MFSIMPKGKAFSKLDQGRILAYHEQGQSVREIGRKLGSSHAAVFSFLQRKQNYGKRRRYGPFFKLSERDKQRILRAASNSTKSSTQIKVEIGLRVSSRTIRNIINGSGVI